MSEHRRIEDQLREGLERLPVEPASHAEFERVRRRARQRPVKQASAIAVTTTMAVVAVALLTNPFGGLEGGGPPQATTLDVQQAAVFMERIDASTREQSPFRAIVSVTAEAADDTDPAAQALQLDGVIDLANDAAELTLSMEPALPGVETVPCTFIATTNTTYYRVPDSLSERYQTMWLEGVGGVPSSSGRIGSTDPRDILALLRGVASLEEIGPTTVRGVATTHYRGTIDPSLLAERTQLPPPTFVDQATGDIPVELWVDADGLPRKITETVTLTVPPAGSTHTLTYRAEFFDFGTPLAPSVPASPDVGADTPADALSICLGVPPSEGGP